MMNNVGAVVFSWEWRGAPEQGGFGWVPTGTPENPGSGE